MRTALWICGRVGLSALPVNGREPLRLAVTPVQSLAPTTVRIRARVEPSGDYEFAAVLFDSAGHRRAIARQSARVVSTFGER